MFTARAEAGARDGPYFGDSRRLRLSDDGEPRPGSGRTMTTIGSQTKRAPAILLALLIFAPNGLAQQGHTPAHADSARADTSSAARDLRFDVAIVADVISDFTTEGSTLESGRRFEVRDVHLALGAAIDSDFRGDFIVALDHESRVVLMEGVLSTTSLPWGLHVRAGRFQIPFGQQNGTHRVFLPTIDYPHVIQRFFGVHGAGGTGFSVGLRSSWLGFRQELTLTALEEFPENVHAAESEHDAQGHVTFEPRPASPANRTLEGLGYTARLRTSWDVSPSAALEISVSGGTGRSTQPFGCETSGHYEPCPAARGETGVNARRSIVGADVALRWYPRGSANAPLLLIQSEFMRQHNATPTLPRGAPSQATYLGPTEDPAGAYASARYRLSGRLYVATRGDWVESVIAGERNTLAASGYLQFVPSELTKFALGFERVRPPFGPSLNRILLQTAIGVGTRGTHRH
jgi:hypothetical protein